MTDQTFNWITALEAAVRTEPDNDTYADLLGRADSWPACATGELCRNLPRMLSGKPFDMVLSELGYDFYGEVKHKRWPAALAIFHQIESRVAVLLKEQEPAPGNLDSRNQ